jgi:hypothetical protein
MTTVTLTNQGNVDVTVSNIAVSPGTEGFSNGAIMADMTVPANNGTRTFVLTFAPTLDAHGMATLNVTTDWNDPALMLVGDGLPVGFSCSPNPAMLGDVRWDASKAQTITLVNTGTATVNVLGVAWLSGATVEFDAIPANTGQGALAMNQMRTFDITARPTDDMLGARNAVLRITTDLPSGMGQFCDIPVSYTSVGPAVTLSPGMTVDFGGVDVDGAPRTLTLQLTNSGTGRMNITSVTPLGGSAFTRTNFADLTLDPGEMGSIDITYDPTGERDPSNPEIDSFTVSTDGLFMGGTPQPPNILINVRGYGVDRHISVADVDLPDTYRNPTEAQIPMSALRVCNTGGAPLVVSQLSEDSDVFELATTADLVVGGGSPATPTCSDVAVRFRPTDYTTYSTMVTLMNDDNANAMAIVMLSGDGILREVDVPATVDLGDVPVDDLDLSGLALRFVNRSTTTFVVSKLEVNDPRVELRLGTPGASLPPGEHALDGILHVAEAGEIEVQVSVFLDGDPLPHGTMTVRLNAVERANYYSCSSGRPVGFAIAMLFAIGLIMVRLRIRAGRAGRATVRA